MEILIKFFQSLSYPTLFFIGLGICLLVGMRQFNRRGLGGLQHFRNYFIGLITLFVEGALKWAGLALMLWGLRGWIFS
ncbi:MAG: hypothetical protein RBS73_13630 [Prolixibacteraceae bacterium]|jgi:hypothetical protein|nr:hypothetical protein [Prolixibacteraceae bacterium]